MQTLGLSDSTPRTEGRLKSLFWPSVQSGSDVDYLGAQGYWVCTLVAGLSFVLMVAMGQPIAGTNYSQFLRNFEIAAGVANGKSRGATFNDGDFYKFVEGASATLAITNDDALEKQLDDIIAVIAKTQETNGYIDTWIQLHQRAGETNVAPLQNPERFEMYNLGQLMTAACVHYRATQKTNFLAVACKAADFLCDAFQNPTPPLANDLICPSHYMGPIVGLYRVNA